MHTALEDLSPHQLTALEALLEPYGDGAPSPAQGVELVACYVPGPGDAPAAADLRRHLLRALPASHVPAQFVAVPAIPRLPSGKADRTALEALAAAAPAPRAEAAAPQGDLQEWIAAVWSVVLGREVRSAHEDFFELGGSSLLVMQVLGRIEAVLGVALPVVTLFENPTVAALADTVAQSAPTLVGPDFDEIVSVALSVYADAGRPAPAPVPA